MTIIQDRPAAETATCPAWCTASHPREDVRWAPNIHYRKVGTLGVEFWADDSADGTLNAQHFTLGDLLDFEDLSLDQARRLADDLIAAADLIDGVKA